MLASVTASNKLYRFNCLLPNLLEYDIKIDSNKFTLFFTVSMLVLVAWIHLFMQRQSKRRANCLILLRVSVINSHWLILAAVFQAIMTQASKRYASCVQTTYLHLSQVFYVFHTFHFTLSLFRMLCFLINQFCLHRSRRLWITASTCISHHQM